jgi:hypothetical protein
MWKADCSNYLRSDSRRRERIAQVCVVVLPDEGHFEGYQWITWVFDGGASQ